jgi:hypothetical protein
MDKQEALRNRLKIAEANINALWDTQHLIALKYKCERERELLLKKLLKLQLLEFDRNPNTIRAQGECK